jgi:hypothetical protein
MRMAIIGYSLYVLVTEPRNTLTFKMFDWSLRTIELFFTTIQMIIVVNSIRKLF